MDPTSSAVPTRLGQYELGEVLGEGGTGVVYAAVHTVLRRKVAVKVLKPQFAGDPNMVGRFFTEARLADSVGHENIVTILDSSESEGRPYIVMETLQGFGLAKLLKELRSLPWKRARHIVTQVCRAMSAAHKKGIVHRDLKTENIFLVEKGGVRDFVKILDFGVARLLYDDGPDRYTKPGTTIGTPEYMAPEQAGNAEPSPSMDIYAIGVLTYEMLTGKVPFEGNTMEVLKKLILEQPPPMAVHNPNYPIPPEVEEVVRWALQKDPNARPRSMEELGLAFAACLESEDQNSDRMTREIATLVVTEVSGSSLDEVRAAGGEPLKPEDFGVSTDNLEPIPSSPPAKSKKEADWTVPIHVDQGELTRATMSGRWHETATLEVEKPRSQERPAVSEKPSYLFRSPLAFYFSILVALVVSATLFLLYGKDLILKMGNTAVEVKEGAGERDYDSAPLPVGATPNTVPPPAAIQPAAPAPAVEKRPSRRHRPTTRSPPADRKE